MFRIDLRITGARANGIDFQFTLKTNCRFNPFRASNCSATAPPTMKSDNSFGLALLIVTFCLVADAPATASFNPIRVGCLIVKSIEQCQRRRNEF